MRRDRPFVPVQATLEEGLGSFERMLRKFIRASKDEGTATELAARRSYMKPSQRRRRRPRNRPER